ncbi:MAG: hypothetical protein ACREAA_06585 [Candidatus Polarisedimenticolia bacterium]
MRLTRVSPSGPQEIQDACLQDLDALLPGASVLARSVPIPDLGTLDLIASEREGRLALVSFHLRAGASDVAAALARWDWICRNLPTLRSLGYASGPDLTADPRLVLVALRASHGARRLAGCIARPAIELQKAALVRAHDGVSLLLDPVAPLHPAAHPSASVEPLLGGLPAGQARSLVRRLVEQLRGDGYGFAVIEGGVDMERQGRLVGSVLATTGGVEARRASDARSMRVDTDEDCQEAFRFLTLAAKPLPASPEPAAGRRVVAPLSPEEIHELERALPPSPPHPPSRSASHGREGSSSSRFEVEN